MQELPEIEALFLMVALQLGEPPMRIVAKIRVGSEYDYARVMRAAQWQADFNNLVISSGILRCESVGSRPADVGSMLKAYISWYKRTKPVRGVRPAC